jgi:hypothetical protein
MRVKCGVSSELTAQNYQSVGCVSVTAAVSKVVLQGKGRHRHN